MPALPLATQIVAPVHQTCHHRHQAVQESQILLRTLQLGKETRIDLQEQAVEPRNHQRRLGQGLVRQIIRHQLVQEHQTSHHQKVQGRQMLEPERDCQRALLTLALGHRIILQEREHQRDLQEQVLEHQTNRLMMVQALQTNLRSMGQELQKQELGLGDIKLR